MKAILLVLALALIFAGCSSTDPVVVIWDFWGPTPKNSYEEAIRTWKAYKGKGKGYFVRGRTSKVGHVELWIDEGNGPEPVGLSPITLSGKPTTMVAINEKENKFLARNMN